MSRKIWGTIDGGISDLWHIYYFPTNHHRPNQAHYYMSYKKTIPVFIGIVIFFFQYTISQEQQTNPFGNKPLKWYLNDDHNRWLGLHTYLQLWARVNQNNPGSLVSEEIQNTTADISIRRFRLAIKGQLTEKLFVYTQFGTNNLNYLSSRGTSLKLLDAYAEYSFSENFTIGGGKSLWNGLSRLSAPSTSKLMIADVPFLALPTVNTTDDLLRNLGLYAKGKFHKIDYRFIISKPFPIQNEIQPAEGVAEFANTHSGMQYAGYVKYEFSQSESNKYAPHRGTYLGNKNVLSVGAGFKYQPDALCSLNQGDERFHDMNLLAADIFLDLPINKNKGTALSAYLGFFEYNFGPNYIRSIGANNPTNGLNQESASFNGKGNSYPVIGTGTSVLYQIGYLLGGIGKNRDKGKLQPYARVQYSDFDRLDDSMISYDLGINYFLNRHLSKFSLNAQNRPVFFDFGSTIERKGRKWMFVLQYQSRIE
ncbi:porin [Aquimarina sp. M1]